MSKYWYVVKDSAGVYYIGFAYGAIDSDDSNIIETMKEYCRKKNYALVLLIQTFPMLPIVNQVYPPNMTEEVRNVMPQLMDAIQHHECRLAN